MKTIGLIGGMSWESSAVYYRLINQGVRERLGGAHSARSLMLSVDFGEIEKLQHDGDWETLSGLMAKAATDLQRGGADFIVICTNTMHKMADEVASSISIPLLHIADAAAEKTKSDGIKRVGLLGTAFTMEQDFYKGRLRDRHGLEVIVPGQSDRKTVHDVIYNELIAGAVEDTSRKAYQGVIARLVEEGVEAIILGCTEIMLLIGPEDSPVPLYDTTAIHAETAVDFALAR